jgi:hypothetical protein
VNIIVSLNLSDGRMKIQSPEAVGCRNSIDIYRSRVETLCDIKDHRIYWDIHFCRLSSGFQCAFFGMLWSNSGPNSIPNRKGWTAGAVRIHLKVLADTSKSSRLESAKSWGVSPLLSLCPPGSCFAIENLYSIVTSVRGWDNLTLPARSCAIHICAFLQYCISLIVKRDKMRFSRTSRASGQMQGCWLNLSRASTLAPISRYQLTQWR